MSLPKTIDEFRALPFEDQLAIRDHARAHARFTCRMDDGFATITIRMYSPGGVDRHNEGEDAAVQLAWFCLASLEGLGVLTMHEARSRASELPPRPASMAMPEGA